MQGPAHQSKCHCYAESTVNVTHLEQCNEQQPVCSNCERRQIKCDFATPEDTPPESLQSGDSGTISRQETLGELSASQQNPHVDPFQQPDIVSTKNSTVLDVADLYLMHHYDVVVAPMFANHHNVDAIALWRIHIVSLGFKHDFLLRGILAVTAVHLAYIHPDKRAVYDLQASTHQSIALASFQDTLAHVDGSNCHAIFAFSCLIIVMTFASRKDKASDFQTDVLQWFYLLRGASIVLQMHQESIQCSFLKPLLDEMHFNENIAAHSIPDTDKITDLFAVCGKRQHNRDVSQAYTLAIHSLLTGFIQASVLKSRNEGTVLSSFVWPINLPPKFLDLLGEEQPEALVVLAHYAILIYWGEDESDNWFLGGWARYMLDTIRELVPQEWHEHLIWPDSIIK